MQEENKENNPDSMFSSQSGSDDINSSIFGQDENSSLFSENAGASVADTDENDIASLDNAGNDETSLDDENKISDETIETSYIEDNQASGEFENLQETIADETITSSVVEENSKSIEPIFEKEDENAEFSNEMIAVRPVKFQQFEEKAPNRSIKKNLDIMQDISMHVSVELGRTKSSIREVMEMDVGSIVELEKIAGEQVEIYVNDRLVAKGEVIVIEDKFGVRVVSTSLNKQNNE